MQYKDVCRLLVVTVECVNCDVYVGGKVRVLELMRFFYLKTQWIENKLCIISKTVDKLKSILNNKHTNIQSRINRKVNIIPETG